MQCMSLLSGAVRVVRTHALAVPMVSVGVPTRTLGTAPASSPLRGALQGKNVLVTGATSGIGFSSAMECAAAGANVLACGRREDRGQLLVQEIEKQGGKCVFVRADMSKKEECEMVVEATVREFGAIHGAFNNAGISQDLKPIVDVTREDVERVWAVNVWGVLWGMQAQIKAMLKSGGGSIVNNSSVGGLTNVPNMGVYGASKHAVEALSHTAAAEMAKQNIRINCVNPGPIRTEIMGHAGIPDEEVDGLGAMTQMGRVGESREVGQPVVFLLSDAASYITASNLLIDGGFVNAPLPPFAGPK
eukprot:TRINITY_DN25754_c0_g1_i1.p1 TRINITY_DN25754_c0_g1~~TRINITY_DN25754_c0_g1_i1.p1  ORF type:complete len:303 (+),score=106.50 TRINITY_DN25754_c0_g1_i1:27-935(+)